MDSFSEVEKQKTLHGESFSEIEKQKTLPAHGDSFSEVEKQKHFQLMRSLSVK